MSTRLAALAFAGALSAPLPAAGQTSGATPASTQIWANMILDYPRGEHSFLELDVEPKIQIAPEGDKWRCLELTPLVEYYPASWVDLEGEVAIAPTHQFEGVDSWEVTPRLGFRVNLFSNLRERIGKGPLVATFGRLRLATLIRWEYRNLWYSDGSPSSHQWRFRARLEAKVGINRADLSKNKTLYATGDLEVFVPLEGDVNERFASKLRSRVGLGYRFSYEWRAEILYIRDENRKTKGDPFATSASALDMRVKVFF